MVNVAATFPIDKNIAGSVRGEIAALKWLIESEISIVIFRIERNSHIGRLLPFIQRSISVKNIISPDAEMLIRTKIKNPILRVIKRGYFIPCSIDCRTQIDRLLELSIFVNGIPDIQSPHTTGPVGHKIEHFIIGILYPAGLRRIFVRCIDDRR